MTDPAPWSSIVAELTGRRLAVYDDLHRGVIGTGLERQAALEWLARHRMIEPDATGAWMPVALATARERYERLGPAEAKPARPAPRTQQPSPPRPRVHTHQAEFGL